MFLPPMLFVMFDGAYPTSKTFSRQHLMAWWLFGTALINQRKDEYVFRQSIAFSCFGLLGSSVVVFRANVHGLASAANRGVPDEKNVGTLNAMPVVRT
jgi:hypothetical protein